MGLSRRMFFRNAGAGAVAAAVAPQLPVSNAGSSLRTLGFSVDPSSMAFGAMSYPPLSDCIEGFKFEVRRQADPTAGLDPDLIAARSFSLSAKLRMQADRDKRRAISNE